jgi:translation initiation factor 1
MAKRQQKTVLFLGVGEAAGVAEALFDSVAGKIGMAWKASSRNPAEATPAELEAADWIVALDELAALPPGWADRVEAWPVGDAESIEREVIDLTARLIGGGRKREPAAPEPAEKPPAPREKAKPAAVVRVGRETKGRRGKGVTTVWDVPLDEAGLEGLAARLKQRCGTGGTVKDGRIEIQGDQRDRVAAELEALGYRVKRVGG